MHTDRHAPNRTLLVLYLSFESAFEFVKRTTHIIMTFQTLSALPTAGNPSGNLNFAHKSSKRVTRFRKDLKTIEENGTWEALPTLVAFPDREISTALRTVCGSTVAREKRDRKEKDLENRINAVTYILEHCLVSDDDEEEKDEEEILVGGAIASASKGRFEILRKLIEEDKNKKMNVINGTDIHGYSPLLSACCGDYYEEGEKSDMESNRRKCIELLLERGADAENRGDGVHKINWTPLMALAKRSDLESLKVLFKKSSEELDVNRTYSNGKTALFVACEWGASIDVINLLLEKGAKNIPATKLNTDYSRFIPAMTPLDKAMENGHHEIVYALNEHNKKNSGLWFSSGYEEEEEAKNSDVEEEVIRNERETKMDFDERAAPTVVQGGESW